MTRPLVERVVAPRGVELPVRKGEKLGEVRVYDRGRVIARSPLVAARSVEEPSMTGVERSTAGTRGRRRRTRTCGAGWLGARSIVHRCTIVRRQPLDRTLTVPNFQRGQRHRASGGLTIAGGKGINIARALKRLDVPVVATGLAGGLTGTRIVEELTAEAILNDFVRIADESRTSTAVVDPTATSYTEINEWGPHVEDEELEMLLEKLRYLTTGAETVVFAGSLPRGVDEGFYGETIRDLNRRGVKTILDSEGEPLRLGTSAEPFLVSPNQREAEAPRRPGVPRGAGLHRRARLDRRARGAQRAHHAGVRLLRASSARTVS